MILTNGFGPDVRVYKEAKYLVGRGFDVEILCWDRKMSIFTKKEIVDGTRSKVFHIPYMVNLTNKSYLCFIRNKEYRR